MYKVIQYEKIQAIVQSAAYWYH